MSTLTDDEVEQFTVVGEGVKSLIQRWATLSPSIDVTVVQFVVQNQECLKSEMKPTDLDFHIKSKNSLW